MSLLMDALKKAEKAKTDVAGNAPATSPEPTDLKSSKQFEELDAMDLDAGQSDDALSLEPLDAEAAAAEVTVTEAESPVDGDATVEMKEEPAYDSEFSPTLPSDRTIKAGLSDYFDAATGEYRALPVESDAGSLEDTDTHPLPAKSTHSGSPAAAATVFAAARPTSGQGRRTAMMFSVLAVALIAVTAALYYLGVETTTPMQKAPLLVSYDGATVTAPDAAPAVTVAPPQVPVTGRPEPSVDPAPALTPAPAPDPAAPPVAALPLASPSQTAPQPAPAPTISTPPTSAGSGEALMLASMAPEASRISIQHVVRHANTGKQLMRAYAAWLAGDTTRARDLYSAVLKIDADNRDALLGMAALAARAGDIQTAQGLYVRVLRKNPQDSVARAGLVSLGGAVPGRAESIVKSLISANPEAAYLYFELGNIYSAAQRWGAAQQAFFNALSIDGTHADYALNLAVSLDHIGKADAALRYYRRAMEQIGGQSAGFDSAAVMRRIDALDRQ